METNFSVTGKAAEIKTPAHLGSVLAAVVVTYRAQGPQACKENLDVLSRELHGLGTRPEFCMLVDALRAGIDERMW